MNSRNLKFFKPFVPIIKTLERFNAHRCHRTWLIFLIQLAEAALSRNPLSELGVGIIIDWHEAVAKLHLEILIAFRDYGFVDHVKIIPPSQLLRVPSHPPGRLVLVDYPELHLAPSRILPLVKLLLVRFYHIRLLLLL